LYLLLTSEYLGQGRLDDAARLAGEASQWLPDYWEVWIARANVAMDRGEFAEAERLLLRAMDTPRAPTARVARWMMLLEHRRSATRPATTTATEPPG
jgi:tetratricopeptide (TPR) repeat protein